jgi:RNA polymerase sigma factor for flagellar operon FliA
VTGDQVTPSQAETPVEATGAREGPVGLMPSEQLVARYQRVNAEKQRQDLILSNLPMVRHVLSRLRARLPHGVDLENLEAAGVLGLVEAASRFDPMQGTRFEAFAYPRIRGAVLDELRRNCPLPQHLLERVARVRKVYRSLPPPVSVEQLAAATDLSPEEVVECLSALRLTRVGSWDDFAGPERLSRTSLQDRPDARAEHAEQQQALADGIAQLDERERLVVTLYYLEDLRLKEVGLLLDLSESRVSRLLKSALFHLAEYLRARDGA